MAVSGVKIMRFSLFETVPGEPMTDGHAPGDGKSSLGRSIVPTRSDST
jgi:hypothetical protein